MFSINEAKLVDEAKKYDKEYKAKTAGLVLKDSKVKEDEEDEDDLAKVPKISMISERLKDWRGWLTEGQFYIYGMVYMLVRIAVNVTMVIIVTKFSFPFIVRATLLLVECDWIRKDT